MKRFFLLLLLLLTLHPALAQGKKPPGALALVKERLARKVPVWLEVMFIRSERYGSNVDDDAVSAIIEKVRAIKPAEVDLNTCVRPPEEPVDPVPLERLNEIRSRMEDALPGISIVVVPKRTSSRSKLIREDEIEGEILRILAVRPCTTVDLSDSLGINPAEVGKYLARLAEGGRIEHRFQDGRSYYAAKEG